VADEPAAGAPPLRAGTRVVHAGLPDPVAGEPFLPGPAFAAPFHLPGPADTAAFGYGRYGNPTWSRYEAALGELEGGEAVLFASGMGAVSAVLLPALRAGDVLVAPSDGYPGVRAVAAHLAERGIQARLAATEGEAIRAALPGADIVWLETPSNPALDVCDIAALAEAAHAEGAIVVVDNTLATPLLQRPLELGADVSVSSGSKHLAGHGDLILGHVAVRDPERARALRRWRTETGGVAGPFEAWLAHRSLATLGVRLARACESAQALAEMLESRPDVSGVRYPGLAGHPGHGLARRQMDGFGSVVGFELDGAETAQRFLDACRVVIEATSFGGVHASAERRARWGSDPIPDGFIRLSAGVEETHDLLTDVAGALDAAASGRA
jgi:cystathionine gamma-lyase